MNVGSANGVREGAVPGTSTIALKVRTGSADANGVLMLVDDHLVAILVELVDEVHDQARGRWALEHTFGLFNISAPETFADVDQAWDWVLRAANGKQWRVVRGGLS